VGLQKEKSFKQSIKQSTESNAVQLMTQQDRHLCLMLQREKNQTRAQSKGIISKSKEAGKFVGKYEVIRRT